MAQVTSAAEAAAPRTALGHVRWAVCALLFFATTINYIDRQIIGILKPTLVAQFGWHDERIYAAIVFSFQLAYAIGLLVAGRVMDTLGTRRGLALAVLLWSLAAIAHSAAYHFPWLRVPTVNLDSTTGLSVVLLGGAAAGFALVRFLLGLAEAGNFPAAIKTVAEWFPRKERALATGIFNSGSNVGALVTPLVVPWVTLHWGWEWAFVLTGATGFLWLAIWLRAYHSPEDHPRLSAAERAHIRSDPAETLTPVRWASLVPHRQTWAFSLGKFMTDPIWWLYLFWIPDFLNRSYGLDRSRSAAARRHLPGRGRGLDRRRLALVLPDQARLERQRRAQDGRWSARWRWCRSCSPAHVQPVVAVALVSLAAAAHQAGRQPVHPGVRHVPAPGGGIGGRPGRHGGRGGRHAHLDRSGRGAAAHRQLRAHLPDRRLHLPAALLVIQLLVPTLASAPPGSGRMRPFIHDDFLLQSPLAGELYHRLAASLPIVDFHCHLPVDKIASDHHFRSLTAIWLDGDHYKWRAMRAAGVPERLVTGDASDWDKFEAWARTVPDTLRNPLHHWTHMELRRPFGIEALLSPATARDVFERVNAMLAQPGFGTLGLLEGFKVSAVSTTDDPVDSLQHHEALARRPDPATRVYPTWRPDRALDVDDPAALRAWVDRLEQASGRSVSTLSSFLEALDVRHQAFHALGCRASDHGPEIVFAEAHADAEVAATFERVRAGHAVDPGAALRLKSALMHRFALMDHARGWVQQFHLGALRDNSTRLRTALGRDCGADSIGDFEQARPLARFLDRLDATGQLARTILYNSNPRDNELFASLIGSFQDGTPGKMQYGAAWWFLDQLQGMERQLDALSNLSLLSQFVGMVTDSRSFLSYSRHEYFRRLLCNLLAEDVRRGLIPEDRPALERLVRRVCFENARDYFGQPLGRAASA